MIAAIVVAVFVVHSASATQKPVEPQQVPAPSDQAAAKQPWPPAGVTRVGKDTPSPVVTKEAKPRYTAAAMKSKIEGIVEMEAVVLTDGTVGEVRVVRSLDKEFGLDDAAVEALKKWRFTPARREGIAVPVLVTVEMTFTLRDKR
jgi:protein TonB